ncbi:MAG: Unknown protein [uncultured Sulfurovum sp.]|uniref:TraD/TraG TraM recognition site domain-containing protein n=1 Tax=uncultured Sulfurovum sp. TaxID=269237 RepID=A0A6S6SHN3_9BACT|nr:MAG: Unknown protein [uncultured Sulfurovum sp.]
MIRAFIARTPNGEVLPVLGTLGARVIYSINKNRTTRMLSLMTFFWFFSPILFMITLGYLVINYYMNIYVIFFEKREVKAKYKNILMPMVSGKIFTSIGYRVYPEEMDEHLSILNDDSEEGKKALIAKEKKYKKVRHRQFGFDVNALTRHHVFLGTTGAGKTLTLMTLFRDIIKNYAGMGIIDGKSDQEIEFRIYNLCKELYYETQFYAIILNSPEKDTPSNTYSSLMGYDSAIKASEFLGEFLESGGDGGGNHAHFVSRGKVALGNVVMHFKNRQKYNNENFTMSDMSIALAPSELNIIYFISHGIMLDLERCILSIESKNMDFKRLMQKAESVKVPQMQDIKRCEVLYAYINQNGHLSRSVENSLGVKYRYFSDNYELLVSLSSYMQTISTSWKRYANVISSGIFYYFSSVKNRHFIHNEINPVNVLEVRDCYNKLKNADSDEHQLSLVYFRENNLSPDLYFEALGLNEEIKKNIENLSDQEMQQHSYAEQQWERLFKLFSTYTRVFGTPVADVDGRDIVSNGKVLFTMIPVLELSSDQIKILAKNIILMFKSIAAIGIAGDKQSATPIQFKIYQNMIKPNPIFLMVMDELGAYIPDGDLLSKLLTQVRSLKIGMLLSLQESISMKPTGNETEQKRLEGNLSKIILENKDPDTKKYEELIPDIEIIKTEGHVKSAVTHKIIASQSLQINKEKAFDIGITSKFAKGCGAYLGKAREEPIFFQSYYVGDNAKNALQIRRFNSYDFLVS